MDSPPRHRKPIISGILFTILGLLLLWPGIKLVTLGGTIYYLIAALCFAATGVLLVRGRRSALYVYATFLAFTIVWALAEVGLDGWKLLPRLDIVVVLGAWLLLPWIRRGLRDGQGRPLAPYTRTQGGGLIAAGLVVVAGTLVFIFAPRKADVDQEALAQVQQGYSEASPDGENNGEWKSYGGTHAADRYVPFDQITPDNVRQLKVAWTHTTGDILPPVAAERGIFFAFEATPIKIGDNIFYCTPRGRIQSLDATTGAMNWQYDPHANLDANTFMNCRGVSSWQAPANSGYTAPDGSQACATRIISPVLDGRIVAVDAATGKPCEDFGTHGFVDMRTGLGVVQPGFYSPSSAPLVVGNLVIEGAMVDDNRALDEPSGVVRAWDARTGKLAWAWDAGRPDPNAPLKPGETYTRGTPNAWGEYTADVKNGLVYIPTGNATPDYWGPTRRPVDNEINSSVVALDLATGKLRWRFQIAHHDVWDIDTPVGPSLIDLKYGQGATIPALVQTDKRGEIFVLNRLTGKPVVPVVERPVSRIGEQANWLSPTQPYSPGLPQMEPARLKPTDVWGATMFDQLWCRIDFRQHDYEGPFTAPTVKGSIGMPANDGVTDWYGGTIDLKRHLLVAPATYVAFSNRLIPRDEAIKEGLVTPETDWLHHAPRGLKSGIAGAYGQPYVEKIDPWLNPLQIPCTPPPWGKLTAIDLQSHKQVWSRQLGTTRDMGPFGVRLPFGMQTGIMNLGGGVATRSGLFIIAGTIDQYLRVFDITTGKLLYEARLPAGAQATPSVYMGKDGREYIAVSVGGHGELRSRPGDAVYAFALPAKG